MSVWVSCWFLGLFCCSFTFAFAFWLEGGRRRRGGMVVLVGALVIISMALGGVRAAKGYFVLFFFCSCMGAANGCYHFVCPRWGLRRFLGALCCFRCWWVSSAACEVCRECV